MSPEIKAATPGVAATGMIRVRLISMKWLKSYNRASVDYSESREVLAEEARILATAQGLNFQERLWLWLLLFFFFLLVPSAFIRSMSRREQLFLGLVNS